MNLFERLVETALDHNQDLSVLRPVVEKELLHHDILRIMQKGGFLQSLVFIGGTCLRSCYGSVRLSEDLDFTGGIDFRKSDLSSLSDTLKAELYQKYELPIEVSEPEQEVQNEQSNVSTWKLKITTNPYSKHLPAQKIHLDICAQTSYRVQPAMLMQHYGVDLGTRGLILSVESLEELLADKLSAFTLPANRIKNRDLWDLLWLYQRNVKLDKDLVWQKLDERRLDKELFLKLLESRTNKLANQQESFRKEMQRFLPLSEQAILEQGEGYWSVMVQILAQYFESLTTRYN